MSLSSNKAALFGKGPAVSATPTTSATRSATSSTSVNIGSTNSSNNSAIFAAARAKRIAEADEFRGKAEGYLKTSFLQWKPDYVAAAPMFERAADLYKQAEDPETAYSMMLKASACHEGYNALASVAVAKTKAALFLKASGPGRDKEVSQLFSEAAEFWGLSGDIQKYGETLAKAAKEMEDADPKESQLLYKKCISILCPEGQSNSPIAVEILRNFFSFLVRRRLLEDALALAQEMVRVFLHAELPGSAHKVLASVTVIQLAQGDAVKAQQTYLQEHMNVEGYLQSRECVLADELTMAFSANDIDKLDAAKRSPEMHYLDQEVQKLGQALSLFGPAVTSAAPAASASAARATTTTSTSSKPSLKTATAQAEASKSSLFSKPGSSKAVSASAPASAAAFAVPERASPPASSPAPPFLPPPPPSPPTTSSPSQQQLVDDLDALHIEDGGDGKGDQAAFGMLSGQFAETAKQAPSLGMMAELSEETVEALLEQSGHQDDEEEDEIDLS